MDGAFPRYSMPSTPYLNHKKQQMSDNFLIGSPLPQQQHYQQRHYNRHSMDESPNVAIMKYSTSSNSSSSSSSSRQSYSPPIRTASSTPQRVPRKPVSNNPASTSKRASPPQHYSSSPQQQKPLYSQQQQHRYKNYHAADTIHPNRMRTYSQVGPMKPPAATIISSPSPSMSTTTSTSNNVDKYVRLRRHSQGSSLLTSSSSTIKSSMTDSTLSSSAASTTSRITSSKTFWYPRDKDFEPFEPLKRGLSKKIRGLLQPHKSQIEQESATNNAQHLQDCQKSLKRSKTPDFIHHEQNPFRILSHTKNEMDKNGPPLLQFKGNDFIQIDNYASTVQQRGPLLTPFILSQKFLVRPYKKDLFRLRSLFIWLIQNIRPEYHQKRNDLILLQRQAQLNMQQQQALISQSTKPTNNIRSRLSKITLHLDSDDSTTTDDLSLLELTAATQRLDAMDLLQEESNFLLEFSNDYINESADEVLEKRTCKSSFGMAHLFVAMALAAGFEDAQVVHGYLKVPKDTTTLENNKLPINHAWCSVKIEGEYRLIDCWLASPFYPQNENKMEAHWFLRKPLDMIMTHLPKDPLNQFLDPIITQHAFFSLPHVRNPFFWHRMRILNFKNHLSSADDDDEDSGVYYISLKLEESNISCYAETEGEDGSIIRGLAQCLTDDHDNRICKIKAVLPSHQTSGWLKIYAGPSLASSSSTTNQQQQQQETIQKSHYPLAMCIRITQPKPTTPFDFVQLYVDHNEFYVQEPQCYKLYPLQTYHFCIRGNRLDNHNRATHHKLAIKSPCGRLYKLMYYPQDQTYDVNVTVSEAGKWSLICLLHHTGGWYTVANWACSILKK